MQYVIKIIMLLLIVAAVVVISIIPPPVSWGQQQQKEATKDTVLEKAKEIIDRFEVVKSKVEQAASLVDSNAIKAQQIVEILDKVKPQKSIRYIPREVPKEKKVFIKVPSDTTLYYVDGQYVDRPVIIYRTCDVKYGGDTFRTNTWRAPGEEGLWRQIFKKRKNAK